MLLPIPRFALVLATAMQIAVASPESSPGIAQGTGSRSAAQLGVAAMEAGDYDEALEHFQRALAEHPAADTYTRAADLFWLTGDSRRAQATLRKALAAGGSPAERAQCRARLGTLLFHEGALLAAEAQFDQALREAPEQPHVLAAAGRFLHARRNYTNAIALLQRSLALATERETMAALVESYSLAGQSERAAEMTDRFLAASHATTAIGPSNPAGSPPKPGLPGGDPLLARFLADRDRDLDLALAEAEAAYAARRTVAITDTLAWCYYKKGRSTDAARLIRRALRWTTSDATLLFHAGMIHAQLGDGVAARRFLYQALNQNPSFDPRSADLAAATLARLGTAGSEPVPPRPVSP